MPKWTEEQELAITKDGMNIIVSAGAGSGKTAVLTERVIRKLKRGIDVDRLLILTFTNAAATEMKERIRSAIIKEGLTDQLLKIDSAYITTFDSFALSITKKYHYLLGIDSDIEIANDLVLKFKKDEIFDKVFDNLYQEEDSLFLKLIKDFTVKDDEDLKSLIKEMYDKLDLKYDMEEYLDNYFASYFNDSYFEEKELEFFNILRKKIDNIRTNLDSLELILDGDLYGDFLDTLNPLLESKSYDSIKKNLDFTLPRLKKGMDDAKPYKEKISNILKDLKKVCIYENREDIINSLLETKDYISIIIKIIKEVDKEYKEYKLENRLYDFLDISKLAIKIVKEYEDVRLELKDFFREILIDEYQDTSDLQELFINFIANDNVYMVGDIKQSIYRFRNANPNLFKDKYNNYMNDMGGFKIDLVKNFRSREETLSNINYIFNLIMDLDLGGADYKSSHQMVFGNTLYNEFKKEEQDSNFELYNYNQESDEYSKSEIEAFIVAHDIEKKVRDKYQVFDKETSSLRDITYDDFVILIDKSTSFTLYKKIFEYLGINLTIIKEETISGSNDLYILKNILVLLKCLSEKKYDKEFSYAYLSVARSYLFNLDDDIIYETITKKDYQDSIIISKLKNILNIIDIVPVSVLLERIIKEFDFYERLLTMEGIEESIIRLDYFKDLALSLEGLGYTYLDFLDYLNMMLESGETIKYSLNKNIPNSVKIMTIHKSKGLEYPICYYTGLTNKFNVRDLNKKFLFDNKYGFITPISYRGLKPTILYTLYKENYIKEDISERIRLFYVALTRAREKMILVTSLESGEEESDEMVDLDVRLKYKSFASILNSIADKLVPFTKEINLSDYNLTKDYNTIKETNVLDSLESTNDVIRVSEFTINNIREEESRFSKSSKTFISLDDKKKLEFGEKLHYLFEITDFKKKDLSLIPSSYQSYFEKFFNSDLTLDINDRTIYKEYEFIYLDDGVKKHGIIDLMLESDKDIKIKMIKSILNNLMVIKIILKQRLIKIFICIYIQLWMEIIRK